MSSLISIKARQLTKKFKNTIALDNITLSFEAGKMHGVIGPEGAGKTTLIRCLLGLLTPGSGKIEYFENDKPLGFVEFREKAAYFPQQQSLYPELSIDEHLEFFKKLYLINEKEYQERRKELLEITQLTSFVDRPAGKLSGGMYKKLGLICALLRAPQVVLLDEPTNGVDPISRREFWDLLYRLLDQKILIIVTTAYMDEAERCGRVHLLDKGKVMAEGEPRELLVKMKVKTFDALFLKQEKIE